MSNKKHRRNTSRHLHPVDVFSILVVIMIFLLAITACDRTADVEETTEPSTATEPTPSPTDAAETWTPVYRDEDMPNPHEDTSTDYYTGTDFSERSVEDIDNMLNNGADIPAPTPEGDR